MSDEEKIEHAENVARHVLHRLVDVLRDRAGSFETDNMDLMIPLGMDGKTDEMILMEAAAGMILGDIMSFITKEEKLIVSSAGKWSARKLSELRNGESTDD